jgi:hypothetical protein
MKKIVIFSGRFQPFHSGHMKTYQHLIKKFPDADVYIATSNKTDNEKSPFDFNEKKLIMTRMFKIPSNRIVQVKNPYNPVEILSNYPSDSTIYIASIGEKDEQRLGGKYFQKYNNTFEFKPYPEAGYVYIAPSIPNAISGTDVRKWLSVKDEIEAENGFKRAYDRFDKEIYTLLRTKLYKLTEMAKSDIDDIEKFADKNLAPYDFEFGKETDHFFQRINDPRNGKEITKPEMIGFFKRLMRNKKAFDYFTEKYLEFVISDKRTNINIPFINTANRLIAKTIMRKPSFKSPDPMLQVESIDDIVYIEFMNKKKGFRKDRIEFKGRKAYEDAVKWGRENIDNFKIDMVKFNNDMYEDINLPVNIGDTLLMGKFKNKKVRVKDIGTDEHGMPTINGKKATTFRILPKNELTENLLLEGGAYGHMAHPFDIDMDLTFGDLKTIVSKALDGELELAREKTDGQALAVSWKDGRLIAARNKGHLANAGKNALSSNELITKFEGRGEISDAFKYAIQDLERAISQLSDAQKQTIFKNGKAFMNCEVIYPASANVIPYGQSLLVFHGTMEYDDAGNPTSESSETGGILAKMIKDINADVQEEFSIQGPPIQNLPKSRELKAKKPYYFNKINQLQKEFGLGDNAGVSEYHQEWWSEWIDKNSPSKLSTDEKEGLIKRWAFLDKSFRLRDLKDPAVRQWAEQTDKDDLKRITKQNIMKFEDIFLGLGADVLSFMTSVLTVNPEVARKQMLASLKSTIEDIQKSGDVSSIKKLELELKRLQSLGGFEKIVPAEGIVFNYKGGTYKLTGAFAPLNQILGIFKYSR